MAEQIKIQYKDDTIEKLKYIDGKSDWIDLRAAKKIEIKQTDTTFSVTVPLMTRHEIE